MVPRASARPHALQSRRSRRGWMLAGAVVVVALATACLSGAEQTGLNAINADRQANGGVAALSSNDALQTKARNLAVHLADSSAGVCSSATLVHSDLTAGAPAGWRRLGENIACRWSSTSAANEVAHLEAQFMASSGHRANILDARFNRGAIGLASVPAQNGSGSIVFEAQEFAQI